MRISIRRNGQKKASSSPASIENPNSKIQNGRTD
jgi:hypothetical protein